MKRVDRSGRGSGGGGSALGVLLAICRHLLASRRWLRALVAIGLLGFVGQWIYFWNREHRFDPLILTASRRYHVEPALVKAVIWKESRFNARALGSVGERGLMQVRDAAGYEWAGAEKRTGFSENQLSDPEVNVHAGSWYLSLLLKRYRATDNPVPYALADYNAGRKHVLRWMQGTAKTNSAAFVARMDYPGTRAYIAAVTQRFEHYRSEAEQLR